MFVKTTQPDIVHDDVIHPAGSVLEVDEVRGKYLVDNGLAVPSDGPAGPPKDEHEHKHKAK